MTRFLLQFVRFSEEAGAAEESAKQDEIGEEDIAELKRGLQEKLEEEGIVK